VVERLKQVGLDHALDEFATRNNAWDWKVTPALHGVASAERREYRDISQTSTGSEIGVRTQRAKVLEGIYDIDGVWRALAGVSRISSSTTAPVSWDASPTVRSARVGGGYEWASGSSLFARFRRGEGDYNAPVLPATSADFRENETDVAFKWILTGKTSLDARLGHLRRTHSDAPARDFSGPVGGVNVVWLATGKTHVNGGVLHDLESAGLDTGGTVKNTRLYIMPVWKATAHTSVNARYERVNRSWRDIVPGLPDNGRKDIIESASIGVEWEPRRIVTLSASVRGERVKSNLVGNSYRNTAVMLGVKVRI
jgi:exopolysaccharide biosynthesis operon protein EpsL